MANCLECREALCFILVALGSVMYTKAQRSSYDGEMMEADRDEYCAMPCGAIIGSQWHAYDFLH